MQAAAEQITGDAAGRTPRTVLIVDDSRVQRRILGVLLARAGYEVIEAGSGEDACEAVARRAPDLVISDWMMTGMTGLDLCQRVRSLVRDKYVYFILLTSKAETTEIARGLGMGADDFLVKPVSGDELRARIAAGERILGMERELQDKNRLLAATLAELQGLYDALDRDLRDARKLQQSLVPERSRRFGSTEVNLLLKPSGHVGGDLVGCFAINARRVGLFAIDVSGHGITSALMTARLAGYLSGSTPDLNIALVQDDSGLDDALTPEDLAAALNRVILADLQTETYFTLAYADIDLVTGHVRLVQAGHPHPVILRTNGTVEFLGRGGLPVGLFERAVYERTEAQLEPGDRLLLMSDGISEAADPEGRQLEQNGLEQMIIRCGASAGPAFLTALWDGLVAYTHGRFGDDVSGVVLDFCKPEAS